MTEQKLSKFVEKIMGRFQNLSNITFENILNVA